MTDRPQFPVREGMMWEPQGLHWAYWCTVYGDSLVRREANLARAWLLANPRRRKTVRGMDRFLVNWFNRAQKQEIAKPRPNDAWMSQGDFAPAEAEAIRERLRAKGVRL